MLNELLNELKQAITAGDRITAKRIITTLRRAGMDVHTITVLLNEIYSNGGDKQ